MIFMIFFLLLFSTQMYFSALIKSHLFDTSIEVLSMQNMQTKLYVESLCVYIGSIIASLESMQVNDPISPIYFSEISFDEYNRIQATVFITKEAPEQFLCTVECVRTNATLQYYARIIVQEGSFTVIACEQVKKELFQ